MINVLITAIGGDIGQGVLKALKFCNFDMSVIGTDIDIYAPGLFLCDKGYIVPSARSDKDKYIKKVIDICNNEKIDIVFSCHEAEQLVISKNIDELKNKTKAFFVVQSLNTLNITANKANTYKYLDKKNIRVPETEYTKDGASRLIHKYNFPIVIKSATGSGSRDFHIIKNIDELKKIWDSVPSPIIQEYIANDKDEEYTVGIFLDNNAKTLGSITMLRKLRFGLTFHAIVDDYPDIADLAVRAAEAVGAVGPCNVQLRRDKENKPCVIEINARISSTVVFRAKLGFNEVRASVDYFLNNEIPKLFYKKAVVMKIWDELIIPVKRFKDIKDNGFVENDE